MLHKPTDEESFWSRGPYDGCRQNYFLFKEYLSYPPSFYLPEPIKPTVVTIFQMSCEIRDHLSNYSQVIKMTETNMKPLATLTLTQAGSSDG